MFKSGRPGGMLAGMTAPLTSTAVSGSPAWRSFPLGFSRVAGISPCGCLAFLRRGRFSCHVHGPTRWPPRRKPARPHPGPGALERYSDGWRLALLLRLRIAAWGLRACGPSRCGAARASRLPHSTPAPKFGGVASMRLIASRCAAGHPLARPLVMFYVSPCPCDDLAADLSACRRALRRHRVRCSRPHGAVNAPATSPALVLLARGVRLGPISSPQRLMAASRRDARRVIRLRPFTSVLAFSACAGVIPAAISPPPGTEKRHNISTAMACLQGTQAGHFRPIAWPARFATSRLGARCGRARVCRGGPCAAPRARTKEDSVSAPDVARATGFRIRLYVRGFHAQSICEVAPREGADALTDATDAKKPDRLHAAAGHRVDRSRSSCRRSCSCMRTPPRSSPSTNAAGREVRALRPPERLPAWLKPAHTR